MADPGASGGLTARIRRTPLRVRITAAFALATSLVILGLGVFVTLRVQQTLVDQTRTALESRRDALLSLSPERRETVVEQLTGETFGQVIGADGDVVASSARLDLPVSLPSTSPEPAGADAGTSASVFFERRTMLRGEDEVETVELLATTSEGSTIVVGTSREHIEEAMGQVVTQLLVAGPLAVLLACALGYWVAGSALRPVEEMRRRADSISASSIDGRLPLPAADDELRRLGVTLNQMLDRLDQSLARERRFVAEASHELRTPLALLRVELDLALGRPRSAEELRSALESVAEEIARLTTLAEDLLLLTGLAHRSSPAGSLPLVDVGEVVRSVVHRFEGQARTDSRVLTVFLDPEVTASGRAGPFVHGDATALDRMVSNLIDNALRHGTGPVDVAGRVDVGLLRLEVRDGGPNAGQALDGASWDSFVRPASARGRGHGLGLTIVRAVAQRHGGHVDVATDGTGGTCFRVVLPDALPASNDQGSSPKRRIRAASRSGVSR